MQEKTEMTVGVGSLAGRYDVVFCDIWGVLHDGVRAYAAAGEALMRWRALGASVVLVSNAPFPAARVAHVLDEKGVRRDAWDAIVSSGDVTRAEMIAHGGDVYHIGPERDRSTFENLPVQRVPLDQAALAVVTGLVHDTRETAEDYREILSQCLTRGLPLICANPDRVVHVGALLLPCAGAIADVYEAMGGTVVWAGKPYRPIYKRALQTACNCVVRL